MEKIDFAVDKHKEWYKGDGWYGDGPDFHLDYYNSFVIQPMMMQQPVYAMQLDQMQNVIAAGQDVNVQQAQFPSFSAPMAGGMVAPDNIGMILDVPMNVTIELGRTKQKIKDIIAYNMGSIIVLDRLAGEAVDILVNGKRIGRGEVVVIDDNYGVRITEINMPSAEELL